MWPTRTLNPDLNTTGPSVGVFRPANGPVVFNHCWQRPLTDEGLSGPDKGKGGKLLILGPGQEAD